jgi:hypothetical protein
MCLKILTTLSFVNKKKFEILFFEILCKEKCSPKLKSTGF